MSKLETLKHLPSPNDVRQNVQQLGQMLEQTSDKLDQTARQVMSLEQLPQLVADQVSASLASLDPLTRLPGQVAQALEAFDQVAQAQRVSLESLAQEMSKQAALSLEQKALMLDESIKTLTGATENMFKGVKVSMDLLTKETAKISALPKTLTAAAETAVAQMQDEAQDLTRAAQSVRPAWWVITLQMVGAGLIAALALAAGQVGLNRLLPPSDLQRNAAWAQQVWSKATQEEIKLMKEIATRPGK